MSTPSKRVAGVAIAALAALLLAWHGFVQPAGSGARWWIAALFLAPILPSLLLLVLRRPSAVFWGGVAALFYFCHGVAEAWATPATRGFAFAELALSLCIIVAGSWDGMRARSRKSGGAPPPV